MVHPMGCPTYGDTFPFDIPRELLPICDIESHGAEPISRDNPQYYPTKSGRFM